MHFMNLVNLNPCFDCSFMAILDTFPVVVWQPCDEYARNSLYCTKYGTTVFKYQLAVSFTGREEE